MNSNTQTFFLPNGRGVRTIFLKIPELQINRRWFNTKDVLAALKFKKESLEVPGITPNDFLPAGGNDTAYISGTSLAFIPVKSNSEESKVVLALLRFFMGIH